MANAKDCYTVLISEFLLYTKKTHSNEYMEIDLILPQDCAPPHYKLKAIV